MLGNIGFTEILLIAVVLLLLFGPNKLPELGRALGRTLREFKQGARELMDDEPAQKEVSASKPEPKVIEVEKVTPEEAAKPADNRRLPE